MTEWPDQRPPSSLYVHVPFCRHRCGYCNFTLVAGRDYLIGRYLSAVICELEQATARRAGCEVPLKSLYLGGGTPTHLIGRGLAELVQAIRHRFELAPDCEFTVEANPEDLDQAAADELACLGVNRISLGVQSVSETKLRFLERSHSVARVANAVQLCRQFARSLSIDLIHSLPDERLEDWEVELASALNLKPDHLSAYELTWEKGTPFWQRLRSELRPVDEDLRHRFFERTAEIAEEHGMLQYEVSSFAHTVEHRSRHNQAYWTGAPWLAVGPGAASFEGGVRILRHVSVTRYLRSVESGAFDWELDEVSLNVRAAEILAIGLRTSEGVGAEAFLMAAGLELSGFLPELQSELVKGGWALMDSAGIRLNRQGLLLHDWIGSRLIEAVS